MGEGCGGRWGKDVEGDGVKDVDRFPNFPVP